MSKYIFHSLLSIFLLFCFFNFSFAQLQTVGPYGGLINAITEDNQGRILAATFLGGIFRSSDNGQSWINISNDTLRADYRSIAVNSNGDIFAGTDGFGLLRSTDDGVTWERLFNTLYTRTVTTILITGNNIFVGTFDGVFVSDDNGNLFNPSGNGITTSLIFSLAANNSGVLFCGTYTAGVFRSIDNGANWSAVNNGLTFNNLIVRGFAFNSAGNILTTIGDNVYLSTNNGDNWNDLNAPNSNYIDISVAANDNILAAASSTIYRSTNNGGNWNELTNWPDYIPPISKLSFFNGIFYAGTSGEGVYNSSNYGDNWALGVEGMNNTHVNEITRGPNNELYAVTSYSGIFYSGDDGLTWENRTNNLRALAVQTANVWILTVAVNPTTGTVFISTNSDYCFRSTDMGMNWEKINQLGILPTVTFEFNSSGHVFTGFFDFLYKSTDDGVTWIQKFPNVSFISDIAVGLEDKIYLASNGQGVSLSTDGGDNWALLNNGLTDLNIKHIEAIKDTTTTLNKSAQDCPGNVACATNKSILIFNDTFWELSLESVEALVLIKVLGPHFFTDRRWLAVAASLLYLEAPECIWDSFDDLLKREIRTAVPYGPQPSGSAKSNHYDNLIDLELLIGTNGGGIYRGTISPTDIQETNNTIPENYYLEQNYPNPFNPSTTVQFSIPEQSFVTLEVFNTLGEKVTTLVSEELNAGNYKVEFNSASSFKYPASGVYFYRLQAGGFVETKKMLLLK